jgi:uncharacterized membrane protein YvlD (DUF360 family)
LLWFVDTLALWGTAAIVGGINIQAPPSVPAIVVAAAAALTISIINLLIRPLILLLAAPLGTLIIFLVGLFANAIVLRLAALLLEPAFQVDTWWAAFLGGLVFSAINTVLVNLMTLNDPDSFYRRRVERLAKQQPFFDDPTDAGRGLLILEIDGLSYYHMQKAIEEGWMPNVREMLETDGYVLSRVDCGLPSQTSGCQTGIMYGRNENVPSFRWFDKDQGKQIESSVDAPVINSWFADGTGLMRGGSSIGNMMNGDAKKSLLTLCSLGRGEDEENKQRARDIYLLMLDPYFFMRTLVLFFGEVLLELWQGARQRIQNVQPRINRLHKGFPFVRAGIAVFVRDVSAYLATLDVLRGAPVVYVNYTGYDEVAHYAGPWTRDAFGSLRAWDQIIGHFRDVIARKAPRPYELIILSDHGQSYGATFKQRYGHSLQEFIEQHLPGGTEVVHGTTSDDGAPSMVALAAELQNAQEQGVGSGVGRAVAGQAGKLFRGGAERQRGPAEPTKPAEPATAMVFGSGNIAQVYFDLYPRKVVLSELEAAYPGLVDALVQHEGVGFVVSYGDDGVPIVMDAGGVRNLHTGEVVGEDPLKPYGDVDLRAEQVRRVADYPNAGDLMVNSTLYSDGTVAAMEELVGNHGGMGGEQTDAFLFHAPDMEVPETKNSADVYPILDARRGLPGAPLVPEAEPAEAVDSWSLSTWVQGIGQVGTWLGRAGRALVLDRTAYYEVVEDAAMTGPALLIALVASILVSVVQAGGFSLWMALGEIGLWLLSVLVVTIAGRLLGGTGDFATTLRGMGFARSVFVLGLLAFIPGVAPLAGFLVLVLGFFAAWMGASQAHDLRGWRSLLLPVLAVLVLFVGSFILEVLVAGLEFTLDALVQNLGLAPSR